MIQYEDHKDGTRTAHQTICDCPRAEWDEEEVFPGVWEKCGRVRMAPDY